MLSREDVLHRFDALRRATLSGGQRAPHKPLLVLYLLGRIQADADRNGPPLAITYSDAERVVSPLIVQFAPPAREKHRAAMPFFHLERTIWRLEGEDLAPKHSRLRDAHAVGMLAPEVERALRADPALLVEVARRILDANFPDSYAGPICEAVGLDLDEAPPNATTSDAAPKRVRSAEFRIRVLRAYGFRCAFCGYDGKAGAALELAPIGIAGAHVQWHALGGPDHVTNGLALCDLHHTLFDRGMIGVDAARRIVVSGDFHGESEMARVLVRDIRGREVHGPERSEERVQDERFEWHRAQVFRGSAA